jgi:hypothetical protein
MDVIGADAERRGIAHACNGEECAFPRERCSRIAYWVYVFSDFRAVAVAEEGELVAMDQNHGVFRKDVAGAAYSLEAGQRTESVVWSAAAGTSLLRSAERKWKDSAEVEG